MNIATAERAILLAVLLAGMATTTTADAADAIKGGKWQITTEMRMPTTHQPPTIAQAGPGDSSKMTRTACINLVNPVPAQSQGDMQCRLNDMQRRGGTVTWSMTGTPPHGPPVLSDGVAHYAGTTMEATFTGHMTAPNGRPVDNPGASRATRGRFRLGAE